MSSYLHLIAISLALCSVSYAQMTSPEPEDDPMGRPTVPKLYLHASGMAPYSPAEMMLPSFKAAYVCPSLDYPTGYNIRCEVRNWNKKVSFRVNGKPYRTESVKPYFLAGDLNGKVWRFKFPSGVTKVRVACLVDTRKPVWIDLYEKCG